MCHVVDRKGGNLGGAPLRDTDAWREAVDADAGHVSDYAASSNGEDFAESCTAYVLTGVGHRLRDVHRKRVADTMPSRSAYFDGLFRRWADEADWRVSP